MMAGPATPHEIADFLSMPTLLRHLGFDVNERTHRTRCLICGGHNRTTFSWRGDGRWHCFRCGAGGDKYALVQAVCRCGFVEALRTIAQLAGLDLSAYPVDSHALAREKRKRRRVDEAAEKYLLLEYQARADYGAWLCTLERLRDVVGEDLAHLQEGSPARQDERAERMWEALAVVSQDLPEALAGYYLLAFASEDERQRFVLFPDDRGVLTGQTLTRGGFRDDEGRFVEVLL
jgi:hypothetical protein